MKNIMQHKNIIITVAAILIAFFVYRAYFKPSDEGLIKVDNQTKKQFAAGKEILTLLVDLKSIELDGSIFQEESFKSMTDFSLPIDPEPKGRTNPFAPIGVDIISGVGEVQE